MGIYYRKRIPIGKWLRVNLSKSGAGLSFGRKGASISTGKRGTFLNWSIPGTGIYSRRRISGPKGTNRPQPASGGTSSGFQLNWKLLFVFAAINLVLGLSSHSLIAYVTAGIFLVLGAIVLFRQMAKQGPAAPPAVGNPPIPPKTSGGQLLTKEMVSKLPANESNFLISRKPIVDVILKELRANRTICVSSFAQRNNYDTDTVDAVMYLLGKMGVVRLSSNSPKTWSL